MSLDDLDGRVVVLHLVYTKCPDDPLHAGRIAEIQAMVNRTPTGPGPSSRGRRHVLAGRLLRQPATTVHATPGGTVYAVVSGTGRIRTAEPALSWQTLSQDGFGGAYPLHFALDPSNQGELYAITFEPESKAQALLASDDGGAIGSRSTRRATEEGHARRQDQRVWSERTLHWRAACGTWRSMQQAADAGLHNRRHGCHRARFGL